MSSEKKFVWKFTNGIELNEKEFLNYFERKVFRTIRKFEMLKNVFCKEINVSSEEDLNTKVLNYVLATKLHVKFSAKPFFSYRNLSDISEDNFLKILDGKFKRKKKEINNMPLYFHSDKEIQLYAKLRKIEGKERVRNKRVRELFDKFMIKNPDIEHNVVNAFEQLK